MSWQPLFLSFQVAFVATAIAGALGVALAGLMSRARFFGSDLVDTLITAPMVLPPTVLGYYLLLGIGRNSAFGQAFEAATGSPLVFTKAAAVLAACVAAFPFVVKSSRAAMEDVDSRLVSAAATLGASPLRAFFTVALPLSRNGLLAGLTLGFARALGDFGVTLMVAGNMPGLTQTGSLAIYDAVQANREAQAAGMVAVMSAFAIAALYLGTKLARRRPHDRGDVCRLSLSLRVDGHLGHGPRLDAAFDSAATITAIMGPSGAGKTTLLECIAGIVRPAAGRIVIDDEVVFDAAARIFVPPHRRRVALVFQSLALFPHLSVWENVVYGIRAPERASRRALATSWLERARAGALADRLPATLSGGEAQRVALARALATEPRLLLLDEPFSALNQELRVELGEVLRELLAATGVPVLLVTHDRSDATRMASRILSLDSGRIVADSGVSQQSRCGG